jgi:redox-sensing transcriptional repressor
MTPVPSATVGRLVTYFRVASAYDARHHERITSSELAEQAGVTAFLVRKDLAHLEGLGTRGAGYDVKQLKERLWERLGLTTPWHVAIVGMGRLGRAIADYPSLIAYNFTVRAGFDIDPSASAGAAPVAVHPMSDLSHVVAQERITIAFLTVPADVAQEVAGRLGDAGVRGILNFTPTVINPPGGVHVESVDFMAGLKRLSYFLHAPGADDKPASSR